jgi:hypothetical protein
MIEGRKTYDVVQVCGGSIKSYGDVVSAHVEIFVVEGLMYITHELGGLMSHWVMSLGLFDHEGRKMLMRTCLKDADHAPEQWLASAEKHGGEGCEKR